MNATTTFLLDLCRMRGLKEPPAAIPILLFGFAAYAIVTGGGALDAPSKVAIAPRATTAASAALVAALAYAVALGYSGRVVRFFIIPKDAPPPPPPTGGHRFQISTLIGKCENIIATTAILTGNLGGLAIIFAAKSWVRAKEIEQNPTFYLGGTLVNLTWSLLCGGVARVLIYGA
jgi:hypothetical protein